jgi:CheY-like chemotaxis protein
MIAYDGREAIDMLQSGSMPDVLLIELDLPGSDGRELLAWLEAERPELARRAVLVTSGDIGASHEAFLETYAGIVVYKPVRAETLLAAVARVVSPVTE